MIRVAGVVAALLTAMLAPATARAQSASSYDFTLTGVGVTASGSFTNASWTTMPAATFFAIGGLTGTWNGRPMTLLPVSNSIGNMFDGASLSVAPFYPIFVSVGGVEWTISREDSHGPTMIGGGGSGGAARVNEPVTFVVTPIAQAFTQSAMPRRGPATWQIGVDVPAAVGVVVGIVEWERHRRRKWHAEPAGRLR